MPDVTQSIAWHPNLARWPIVPARTESKDPPMDSAPRIQALATAVPPNRWTQDQILEALQLHFPRYRDRRVARLVKASGIENRHLAFGPEDFDPTADADALHDHYRRHARILGLEAARKALGRAGLTPEDVDCIVATTCTGYVCPGLTGHLGAALGLRDDVQRADLVGMGCAGAMPSLQRAHDFVRAYPDRRVLVVNVEISSACWFVDDSLETVVGNTICADGAAAMVIAAGGAAGPRLDRFETLLEPAFLDSVGLEFQGGRQRIVLSKDLRFAAGPLVRRAVDRLLDAAGLSYPEVDRWIVHSGGKRVLDSIDRALGFDDGELGHSRAVLRDYGNMSSPTLLFVLERAMGEARRGETGVLIALGPGLAAETGLVRF
jgi:predicted naringenin-chalcone synthase